MVASMWEILAASANGTYDSLVPFGRYSGRSLIEGPRWHGAWSERIVRRRDAPVRRRTVLRDRAWLLDRAGHRTCPRSPASLSAMDRRRVVGIALGAISGVAYGTGPLFAKSVYGAGLDWIALLAWRFFFAMLVSWLWLLVQPRARAELRLLDRRTTGRLLFTGATFILTASVYYAAIERIPTSLEALLMYAYPAVVAVLSMRLGYPFRGKLAWGSLAVVLVGAVLTIGGIEAGVDQLGVAIGALSPLAYAIYIILAAWMAGERPGQTADMRSKGKGAEVSPPVAGAVMMTGTWLTMFVIAAAAREPLVPTEVPMAAWPGLFGIGLFAAAIAIQAFYASVARIGAAQASLIATVEPLVVIALGVTFLGEMLTRLQVLGALLVLIGVLLAQTATPAESRKAVLEEV